MQYLLLFRDLVSSFTSNNTSDQATKQSTSPFLWLRNEFLFGQIILIQNLFQLSLICYQKSIKIIPNMIVQVFSHNSISQIFNLASFLVFILLFYLVILTFAPSKLQLFFFHFLSVYHFQNKEFFSVGLVNSSLLWFQPTYHFPIKIAQNQILSIFFHFALVYELFLSLKFGKFFWGFQDQHIQMNSRCFPWGGQNSCIWVHQIESNRMVVHYGRFAGMKTNRSQIQDNSVQLLQIVIYSIESKHVADSGSWGLKVVDKHEGESNHSITIFLHHSEGQTYLSRKKQGLLISLFPMPSLRDYNKKLGLFEASLYQIFRISRKQLQVLVEQVLNPFLHVVWLFAIYSSHQYTKSNLTMIAWLLLILFHHYLYQSGLSSNRRFSSYTLSSIVHLSPFFQYLLLRAIL